METPTRAQSTCLLIWGLVASLLSQNLVFLVFSASSSTLQDQKNFYFPPFPSIGSPPVDPNIGSPPVTVLPPVVTSPPIVYHTSPPPSHGSGGSSPPVHHTPSHGGSSGGGHHHGRTPPTNCGNPTPRSPPRHVDPSPGHHNPSPAPPTYHYSPPPSGGSGTTPAVPSFPPIVLPPMTPGLPFPSPPRHVDPSPGHHNPSPAPPTYHCSPPPSGGSGTTPAVPSFPPIVLPPMTPGLPFPSPPFDPNSPPIGGPCNFWRNHPTIIWGLFGWYGPTIGSAFGVGTLPGTGANLNLLQALSNTRTDGIGALYREGTASLLNSMVNKNFPYTTSHVKDSFVAAVGSNKAAAAQARVFKLANEGHMKKLRV